jgi:hypothetical protein
MALMPINCNDCGVENPQSGSDEARTEHRRMGMVGR